MIGKRPQELGELIRALRVRFQLTQEALAEKSDVPVRTISDIERGIVHKPQAVTFDRLINAFALTPAEISELRQARNTRPTGRKVRSAPSQNGAAELPRDLTFLRQRAAPARPSLAPRSRPPHTVAAIARHYHALDPSHQQLFRRLAIFVDGVSADAVAMLEESRDYWQAIEHKVFTGQTLFFLALVAWRMSEYGLVMERLAQAFLLFREWDDNIGMGVCRIVAGIEAHQRDESGRALKILNDARDLCWAGGFPWGVATSRYFAGEVARDQGDLAHAVRLFHEALAVYWGLEEPWGLGACVAGLATAAIHREPERVARLFGAADKLRAMVGAFLPTTSPIDFELRVRVLKETLGDHRFQTLWAEGQTLAVEDAIADALNLAAQMATS